MAHDTDLPKDLTERVYSVRDWLLYHANTWRRYVAARTIDVLSDSALKSVDPKMLVDAEPGEPDIPVEQRLETRRSYLASAVEIVNSAEALLAMTDDDMNKYWTPDALKVDKSVYPAVGKACVMPDGTAGVYTNMNGALVCALPADTTEAEKPATDTQSQTTAPAGDSDTVAPAEQSASTT